MSGPLVQVTPLVTALTALNVENQGPIFGGGVGLGGAGGEPNVFNFSNTVFQISGQLTNLQSLPFAASFNASNMVPGQNVFFTTHKSTSLEVLHTHRWPR